jgi:hypothetical protein
VAGSDRLLIDQEAAMNGFGSVAARSFLLVVLLFSISLCSGQNGNTTSNTGLKPYGSYQGGDLDNISLLLI